MHSYENGDFRKQTLALDESLQALEYNFLSFTLWNYTPQNTNADGDLWNNEDLSLFSKDQISMYVLPQLDAVLLQGTCKFTLHY